MHVHLENKSFYSINNLYHLVKNKLVLQCTDSGSNTEVVNTQRVVWSSCYILYLNICNQKWPPNLKLSEHRQYITCKIFQSYFVMCYIEKHVQASTSSESLWKQILPASLTVINFVLCTKLLRLLWRLRSYCVHEVYMKHMWILCLDLSSLSKDSSLCYANTWKSRTKA